MKRLASTKPIGGQRPRWVVEQRGQEWAVRDQNVSVDALDIYALCTTKEIAALIAESLNLLQYAREAIGRFRREAT